MNILEVKNAFCNHMHYDKNDLARLLMYEPTIQDLCTDIAEHGFNVKARWLKDGLPPHSAIWEFLELIQDNGFKVRIREDELTYMVDIVEEETCIQI